MARNWCLFVSTDQGVIAFGPYRSPQAAVAARRRAEQIGKRCSAAPLLDPRDAPKHKPKR